MAEQTPALQIGPKKRLTKLQAATVMVIGALMILIPWFFFPVEQGSVGQIVKTVIGVSGFGILCAGSYYRP
jgi:hypothetical protein